MPSDSIAGFLDHAQAARVLFPEQVEQLIRQPDLPQTDLARLCEYLLTKGVLTKYQAAVLRDGRGQELNFAGYPVLDEIGPCVGGTAYRASHPSLRSPVELRRLRTDAFPPTDNPAAYVGRARAAAGVTHPHLVVPLDAGFHRDEAFVALDRPADAVDLGSLVQDIGPMPGFLAAEYGREAAAALRAVHERGLVHGDVCPENLLVGPVEATGKTGPDGKPRRRPGRAAVCKLAGLGLAPFAPPAAVVPPPISRAAYLPPERLDGAAPTPRGDLYALGATLYYLLTTRPPFPGTDPADILTRVRTADPASLSVLRPDLPGELVALVGRLMAKHPDHRPATAFDAEAELGKFGRAVPTAAPASDVHKPAPMDLPDEVPPTPGEDWTAAGFGGDAFAAAHAEAATAPPRKRLRTPAEKRKMYLMIGLGFALNLTAVLLWVALFTDVFKSDAKPTDKGPALPPKEKPNNRRG